MNEKTKLKGNSKAFLVQQRGAPCGEQQGFASKIYLSIKTQLPRASRSIKTPSETIDIKFNEIRRNNIEGEKKKRSWQIDRWGRK